MSLSHLLLTGEQESILRQVLDTYHHDFAPRNGAEAFLVHDLVVNHWRIWRLQAMETAIVNHQIEQQGETENRFQGGAAVLAVQTVQAFSSILPLISKLESAARRAFHATLRLLHRTQSRRQKANKTNPTDSATPENRKTNPPQTAADSASNAAIPPTRAERPELRK